jgi:hypothetical protein
MRKWMGYLIGAMLVSALFAALAPFAAAGYTLNYGDGTDYMADHPNMDIKTLSSSQAGATITVTLEVYGATIDTAGNYKYMIWAGDAKTDGDYLVLFVYDGDAGGGTLTMTSPTSYDSEMNSQSIIGNDLSISFPMSFAGPADSFDIFGYTSWDGSTVFDPKFDEAGGSVWEANAGYDFAVSTALAVPGTDNGFLAEGQYDVYSMLLSSGQQATITLSGPASADFDLYLYDASEDLLESAGGLSSTETIQYTPYFTGTFYAVVESDSGTGSYSITVSKGGTSTGGFAPATPDTVPWATGSSVSIGGYIDLGELVDDMLQDAEQSGELPAGVDVSASGGFGEYFTLTYTGTETIDTVTAYKFDYTGRVYLDASASFDVSMSEADTGGYASGSASGSGSATVDVDYGGSFWLGYYENPSGKGYYGVEKQTLVVDASGTANVDVDMDMTATYDSQTQTMSGSMSVDVSLDGSLDLTMTHEPGIPFLPAKDEDVSVERSVSTHVTGHATLDGYAKMSATGALASDIDPMDETANVDQSVDTTTTATYSLSYTASNNEARTTAMVFDGYLAMMDYTDLDDSLPGGTRQFDDTTTATYDPNKGMYTSYKPAAMSAVGDLSGIVPVDIPDTGSATDFDMTEVSADDAASFQDDPSGFLAGEGVSMPSAAFPWLLVILGLVVVVAIVAVVLVLLLMKKKKEQKFHQHPEPYQQYPQQGYQQPPPQQYPPQQYEQQPPPPPPQQQPPQYPQQ